jgi:hypothetical protein
VIVGAKDAQPSPIFNRLQQWRKRQKYINNKQRHGKKKTNFRRRKRTSNRNAKRI